MSTEEINLTGFHPKMRDLVGAAVDLGWVARQEPVRHSGRGSGATVVLHSHDGTQTIRATPVRQVNEAKLATMQRKVVRYADPTKRLLIAAGMEQVRARGGDELDQMMATMPHHVESLVHDQVTVEREILAEEPWLARKAASRSGGRKYESAAVIERRWSDGAMDYVCAFEGCGWTNEKPRSVARHYGALHTRNGEAEAADEPPRSVPAHDYFEPLTHREYRPTRQLVKALAEALAEHMQETPEQIAESVLKWFHDRYSHPRKEGDDGLLDSRLLGEGEGVGAVYEALQRALAAGVLDPFLREAGEVPSTVWAALRALAQVRGPNGSVAVPLWLGEPVLEATGGLPAGARPSWYADWSVCGWLLPSGRGVGSDVGQAGVGVPGGPEGSDVLAGPGGLPATVPPLPPTRGLAPEELLDHIRALIGSPLQAEVSQQAAVIAGLEADVMARDAVIERLREERRALAALMSEEAE